MSTRNLDGDHTLSADVTRNTKDIWCKYLYGVCCGFRLSWRMCILQSWWRFRSRHKNWRGMLWWPRILVWWWGVQSIYQVSRVTEWDAKYWREAVQECAITLWLTFIHKLEVDSRIISSLALRWRMLQLSWISNGIKQINHTLATELYKVKSCTSNNVSIGVTNVLLRLCLFSLDIFF